MTDSDVVFGVDISSGSARGRSPRYSLVVLDEEAERYGNISLMRLLRLVRKYQPRVIAVDNVFELAGDHGALSDFIRRLPPQTDLIQVTGADRPEKLPVIARRHGIKIDASDPMQEAEACAVLARAGVGFKVILFEDRTFIKVSRARSLGKGGWSQNRYRRRVHGSVRSRTREIKAQLDSAGLSYDLRVKHGYGGYVRGEFTVHSPRSEVGIRPSRYGDVQVSVTPIERENLEFVPLGMRRDYVIVGIDPGTTTAVAILDLEGRVLDLTSSRTMSRSDVVEHITRYGRPLIVASDVSPMPEAVDKIRRAFGAVAHQPSESLSTEAKIDLSRGVRYRNDHERDALSAAREAYSRYRNKFQQIMRKTPQGVDAGEVLALVARGESISSAIKNVTEAPSPQEPVEPRQLQEEVKGLRKALRARDGEISELNDEIKYLEKKLWNQSRTISRLRKKLGKRTSEVAVQARRDLEVQNRDEEIRRLRKELSEERARLKHVNETVTSLRRIRKMELSGDMAPVKVLSSFSREDIQSLDQELGIKKGDILFIVDPSGGGPSTVDLLEKNGVRAVITEGEMSHTAREALFESDIPILTDLEVRRADTYAAIEISKINEAIEAWEQWAEAERKRRDADRIEAMFREYRSERARE